MFDSIRSIGNWPVVALLLCILPLAYAEVKPSRVDPEVNLVVADLLNPVGETASLQRNSLLKQRRLAVEAARVTVRRAPDTVIGDHLKANAIELLMEFRDTGAVNDLVGLATWVPRVACVTEPGPLSEFPAARALVAIGERSWEAIIARLTHPATDHEIKVFAYVLSMRNGRENREFGLSLVEEARRRFAPNTTEVINLDRIIRVLRGGEFGQMHDWPKGAPSRHSWQMKIECHPGGTAGWRNLAGPP